MLRASEEGEDGRPVVEQGEVEIMPTSAAPERDESRRNVVKNNGGGGKGKKRRNEASEAAKGAQKQCAARTEGGASCEASVTGATHAAPCCVLPCVLSELLAWIGITCSHVEARGWDPDLCAHQSRLRRLAGHGPRRAAGRDRLAAEDLLAARPEVLAALDRVLAALDDHRPAAEQHGRVAEGRMAVHQTAAPDSQKSCRVV